MSTLAFSPLVLSLWTMAVAQTPPPPSTQEVNPTSFTSSRVCGECHQAIHAVWQRSTHATSFTNGVFQAAYQATKKAGEQKARVCLQCHAPTTRKTQDFTAADPITREGVSCDFCHSIHSISMNGSESRIDLVMGRIKYGPLHHAKSPAHEVIPTELHRRSEFCAPCHEYRNPHGVAVLETYSEWKAGPYAAEGGKQCQNCHMPMIPGRTVAPGLKSSLSEGVNLHNISGSHDLEQVRKAVAVEIVSIEQLGADRLSIQIAVTNVGSGHCFPTGLPMHRGILELNLTDRGRSVARREIPFEKVLLDAQGDVITRENEAFLEARSISLDTRLKPKERRIIPITLRDVVAPEGVVDVVLWYQYNTRVLKTKNGQEQVEPVEMKILLASDRRAVPKPDR